MTSVDDFIFGNSAMHEQLCVTAAILGKLVSSAPRAVTLAQLEECSERSTREVKKLCASLLRVGLLRQEKDGAWALACAPSAVTLEDVFRCVVAEQQARVKASTQQKSPPHAISEVELLIMQATMAVNQSVFQHLRQFSLDRMKRSSGAIFPMRTQRYYHA